MRKKVVKYLALKCKGQKSMTHINILERHITKLSNQHQTE